MPTHTGRKLLNYIPSMDDFVIDRSIDRSTDHARGSVAELYARDTLGASLRGMRGTEIDRISIGPIDRAARFRSRSSHITGPAIRQETFLVSGAKPSLAGVTRELETPRSCAESSRDEKWRIAGDNRRNDKPDLRSTTASRSRRLF